MKRQSRRSDGKVGFPAQKQWDLWLIGVYSCGKMRGGFAAEIRKTLGDSHRTCRVSALWECKFHCANPLSQQIAVNPVLLCDGRDYCLRAQGLSDNSYLERQTVYSFLHDAPQKSYQYKL